jgi:lipopolysaccharide export system protein LptA
MILLIIFLNTTPFKADRVEIVNENGESLVNLSGNVLIEQESTMISCIKAQLNEKKMFVILKDSICIKEPAGEIRADNAIYFFDKEIGTLRGNVRLKSEDQIFSADSLDYDGKKRIVWMYKNVYLKDIKNNAVAHCQEGWYNLDEEVGSLIKKPEIEIKREDRPPIIINAREFLLKTKENLCYGYDSVIVKLDSITLFCDTIIYNMKKNAGYVLNPLAVEKNNELKGRTGEFGLKDNTIDYFKVSPGIASYWTNEGNHNVIEGDTINILFKEGRAFRIKVVGNPNGTLYLKKEKANAGD